MARLHQEKSRRNDQASLISLRPGAAFSQSEGIPCG